MPKAKLYRNERLTKAPNLKRKRKKEDGRPQGTFKKYRFEETRLGFMLKYETPVVFDIIMNMTPPAVIKEPPLLLIRMICRASKDPSFKKKKFFKYLEEYARLGLCCKRPRKLTSKREAYYKSIREKKMKSFIKQNRDKIELLRKQENK